jgi:hypothetical protein
MLCHLVIASREFIKYGLSDLSDGGIVKPNVSPGKQNLTICRRPSSENLQALTAPLMTT